MKLSKSLATFGKYLFWTAVAAAIQGAINHLAALHLPDILIPFIGALLKAAATWVATEEGTP